jgi:CO/xanthine dehydrogenase Mo-binding subunit
MAATVPGHKPLSCSDLMALAVKRNNGSLTHLSVYEPRARARSHPFAAQVAEVEVDPGTGQVKIKKLATVHDSGTVLNHLSYTGQIDGGVVTGIGFALMEDNSGRWQDADGQSWRSSKWRPSPMSPNSRRS